MRQKFLLLVLSSLFLARPLSAGELTILPCQRLKELPQLDGRLDDPCWKEIETAVLPYLRGGTPDTKLETSLKLGFDEDALYIDVFCFKKDIKRLRAEVTRRGDMALWSDDSLEIYIDPDNTPVSFNYFVVNSLGTQADDRKDSLGSRSSTWAPEEEKGWKAKANTTQEGWGVEVMIPWKDLGKKPKEGDIWTFALIRFDWSDGNWIAATTSPGALSNAKECFGFLAFGEDAKLLEKVIRLASACSPSHTSESNIGESLFVYEEYGKGLYHRLTDISSVLEQCRVLLPRVSNDSPLIARSSTLFNEVESLQKELGKLSDFGPAGWQSFLPRMVKLHAQLEELLAKLLVPSDGK
ncbi:MAG: sugar-binding protein [Candidatus Omnitrophota bacterium]